MFSLRFEVELELLKEPDVGGNAEVFVNFENKRRSPHASPIRPEQGIIFPKSALEVGFLGNSVELQ